MYVKKLLCGYCKSHQGGSFKMELQFKENKKSVFSESMNDEAQGMGGDPQEEAAAMLREPGSSSACSWGTACWSASCLLPLGLAPQRRREQKGSWDAGH